MDDFMNKMGLGDPDPSNHRTGFSGADEIVDWFKQDKPDDWSSSVTDDIIVNMDGGVGGSWNGDQVTKLNIAKNLVEKIEDLLGGKAHYIECISDRATYHKKIVIEYDHEKK